MSPTPMYDGAQAHPAYCLRYSWAGWFKGGVSLTTDDVKLNDHPELLDAWDGDGLRLLQSRFAENRVQLTFSTNPAITPVFLATRAKGRLDGLLRKLGLGLEFQRNFSVRSVGKNTRRDIEKYISDQVKNARFVDLRTAALLEKFTWTNPACDLSAPVNFGRGLYWYCLHIVLTSQQRLPAFDEPTLQRIFDGTIRIAEKKGFELSAYSVMPEHLHISVRPSPDLSPLETAVCFQNNLAHMLGCAWWAPDFYVGTFSEYVMSATREAIE
jgi:REP element-mobilizing transposase RayT